MRVSVENRQQYAIYRGGHAFPPDQTIEVDVSTPKRLAEIKACVYLKVRVLDEPGTESPTIVDTPPAVVDPPQVVEVSIAEALGAMRVADLRERAAEVGIEVSSRANKSDLIAAILEALEALNIDTEIMGDLEEHPPFDEWELDGLIQLAGEWELELPEDVDHETAVVLIQAEYDRRQLLDAEPIETGEAA